MTVCQSPECSFGAAVLKKHLAALRQEVDGVRQAEDIEHIHRMRVASRRLRAALPLFAACFPKKALRSWKKQVRELTLALGSARDTDVQLELLHRIDAGLTDLRNRPGLHRLQLRITQQRQRLQGPVDAALDKLEANGFYTELETALVPFQQAQPVEVPITRQLYQRSAAAILELLDAFLTYAPYIQNPENIAELHAMRIAAKKLRYTMETFTPLYPETIQSFLLPVKASQELLGDIHDCDVWSVFLPGFIGEERERTLVYYGHINPLHFLMPGLHYFQENRLHERARRYAEFLEQWQKWKEVDLWNQLRGLVTTPLISVIFPPAATFSNPPTG
jgi:CHAD domain-containing protein